MPFESNSQAFPTFLHRMFMQQFASSMAQDNFIGNSDRKMFPIYQPSLKRSRINIPRFKKWSLFLDK